MAVDRLFKHKTLTKFTFNHEVSEVFDDMVRRSVPFYEEVNRLCIHTIKKLISKKGVIIDLGCSTGQFLIQLALHCKAYKTHRFRLIGIDNSADMLEQAKKNIDLFIQKPKIELLEEDFVNSKLPSCDGVILNYSLQFIPKAKRIKLLKNIYAALNEGGILILSEKVTPSISELEHHHLDFKREHGYSELEISRKRDSLENVLVPNSLDENSQLLKKAGFSKIDLLFHWVNFTTIIARKDIDKKDIPKKNA